MELEAFTRAVRDILDAVPAMTLATCAGGKPWATDVYFAPRGFNLIFFFSSPGSRHCRNLVVSAACAVTVHPQVAAWREIRGLQREGRAGPMDGLAQKASAMAAYLAKFPFVKDLLAAPGEAAGKMAKVAPHDFRPTRIRYLDNALGFGARFPKLAYVFDKNVDIFNDDRVKWAMAWRYDPRKDTLIIPELNVLPLDPLGRTDKPPVFMSKVGFDCTIPVVGDYDLDSFMACTITEPLGDVPPGVETLSEEELTRRMDALIRAAPRTWLDIFKKFHGQPNPLLYRAFGNLRGKLGRVADRRPEYPYTFADTWFVYEKGRNGE